MAVEAIYLGTFADLDPSEGNNNWVSENLSALIGEIFGSSSDPLESASRIVQLETSDNIFNPAQGQSATTFTIDGGAPQTFDGGGYYGGTITYDDGSTAGTNLGIIQDTNGNLYLVPEANSASSYGDTAAYQAGNIESIEITSALASGGMYTDFVDDSFAVPDDTVDGEETGEEMVVGYDDSAGATDGGGAQITAGDDSILGNGGSDTISGGDGDDTVEGGEGDDDIAVGGADSVSGGSGDDVFTIDTTDAATEMDVTIDGGSDGTGTGTAVEADDAANGDVGDILDLSDQTNDLTVDMTGSESGVVDGIDATDDVEGSPGSPETYVGPPSNWTQIQTDVYQENGTNNYWIDLTGTSTGTINYTPPGSSDIILFASDTDATALTDVSISGYSPGSKLYLNDMTAVNTGYDYGAGGYNWSISLPNGTTTNEIFNGSIGQYMSPFPEQPTTPSFYDPAVAATPAVEDDDITFSEIEQIKLGSGDDTFTGAEGDDYVDGGAGNDSLLGGAGDDTLIGGDEAPTFTYNYTTLEDISQQSSFQNANGDTITHVVTSDETVGTISGDYWIGDGGGANTEDEVHTHTMSQEVAGASFTFYGTNADESWGIVLDGEQLDLSQAIADGTVTLSGSSYGLNGSGNITLVGGSANDYETLDIKIPFTTLEVAHFDDDPSAGANGTAYALSVYTDAGVWVEGDNDDTIDGDDGDDVIDGGIGDDSISGGDGDDVMSSSGETTESQSYTSLSDVTNQGSFTNAGGTTITHGVTSNETLDYLAFSGIDGYWIGNYSDPLGVGENETHTHSFSQEVAGGEIRFNATNVPEQFAIILDGQTIDLNQAIADGTVTLTGSDYEITGSGEVTLTGSGNGANIGTLDIQIPFTTLAIQHSGTGGDGTIYELSAYADEVISPSDGNDTFDGGDGDDTFVFLDGFGSDTVVGGEGAETVGDQIDLSGLTGPVTVDYTGAESGTITDGTDTITFSEIEQIILTDFDDSVDGIASGSADYIDGRGGDDTINSGGGADTILGGDGNDSINAYSGDDSIDGGDGDDYIQAEFGNDTVLGGEGNDTINGFAGNDSIDGGIGNDSLIGENGNDTVFGGAGEDTLKGQGGTDFLDGGLGNDSLEGGQGDDTVSGGLGDDTLEGNSNDDMVLGGEGNDQLTGDAGNDSLQGDAIALDPTDYASDTGGSAATLSVTNSADGTIELHWIDAGGSLIEYQTIEPGETINQSTFVTHNWVLTDDDGNILELIEVTQTSQSETYGDGGLADNIFGGTEDDLISGQFGDDTLDGEQGDDTLDGGTGDDLLTGGDGDNIFLYTAGDGDDTITDFNSDNTGSLDDSDSSNNDYIDLASFYDNLKELYADQADDGILNQSNATDSVGRAVDYDDNTDLDGSLTFTGASADNTFFTQENTGVVCFTSGTDIQTPQGNVLIENLQVGDLVSTLDNGPQPIRWIGKREIGHKELAQIPRLRPVLISAGTFGLTRDLLVSPQHCILWNDYLVRAKHLVDQPGVRARFAYGKRQVTYIHLFFARHEIIFSNGAPTESLYPGPYAMQALGPAAQLSLLAMDPKLTISASFGPTARKVLTSLDLRSKWFKMGLVTS